MAKPTPELDQAAWEAIQQHGSAAAAARALGVAVTTLKDRARRFCSANNAECSGQHTSKTHKSGTASTAQSEKLELNESGDTASLNSVSGRIRTVEQALEYAEIDPIVWDVDRSSINSWEVYCKGEGHKTLWQVKVFLKRRVPRPLVDAIHDLCDDMREWSRSAYVGVPVDAPEYNSGVMVEISLFDHHFGMLAWEPETGNNYDLRIAEKIWDNAASDLIDATTNVYLESYLLPVGQDFFHVNDLSGTTVNGTSVDTEGRYHKMFQTGVRSCVRTIEKLASVAPVRVIWVPGNHDRLSSYHLCSTLKAWFNGHDGVEVDISPTFRKYVQFGVNLLMFTHGNEEKHSDLPLIMASEQPEMWAESKFREIHVGHNHRKRELQVKTADEYGAVRVRTLPSLSGRDSWHVMRGYIGARRAAEAYCWHREHGYLSHHSVNAREE